MNLLVIASLMLIAFCSEPVLCGGGTHHQTVKIEVPYKIHTIHHHHTEKFPVYKKIEVPVVKEVKVPYPVHVPIKVPYPVVVKPHVVTVPVHHHPVHTEEHQHHESHHHHEEHDGHGKDW
ncbi:hypothetical protein PVAND_000550 [Polypedilum vanderplanki]|uniref:Uncharacterized protein n=1 Tax=Polypedilum vanderplanki TaxID=319348 RepID=A0A9J6BK54_POLVA|nr:hypothetical protein PVAND_000550 [Polypedilum vanderplanki]